VAYGPLAVIPVLLPQQSKQPFGIRELVYHGVDVLVLVGRWALGVDGEGCGCFDRGRLEGLKS
jgi:hypothetical protein